MAKKRKRLGFLQAFTYVLDLLCFAYYVKNNNLVSDKTFDELEKLFMEMFATQYAPMRGIEERGKYSTGVQVIYGIIEKDREEERKKKLKKGK